MLEDGLVDPASTGLKDCEIQDDVARTAAPRSCRGLGRQSPRHITTPSSRKVAGRIVAAVVPGEGGKSRTFGLPDALGIPANSQHKEAAVAFIKWWMEPANQIEADATLGRPADAHHGA